MDDIRLNCGATSGGAYTLSIALIDTRHQQCIVTLAPQTNYFDKIDKAKHIKQWTNITKINFVKVSEAPETFGLQLFLTLESDGKETQVVNMKMPAASSNFLYIDKNQLTGRRLQIQAQEIRDSIDFDEWKQFGWICTKTADSIVFESTNKHPQKPSEEGNKQPEKLITTAKNAQELLNLKVNWNYYEVLGIKPDAQERDIKNAFNKKIVKWHADKHPLMSDELKNFMLACAAVIEAAWRVLTNKAGRRNHDKEMNAGGFTIAKINGKQIRVNTWVEHWHLWTYAIPDDFVPFKTTSPFRYFIDYNHEFWLH